jgi:acetyl-CoA acyltransferase 1
VAERLDLPILGKFVGHASVGVPVSLLGISPIYAIPKVLRKTGIGLKDIEVIELNEAFASQFSFCCQKLELDMTKVNRNGGAIALGHPLGCTGARQVVTLLNELKRVDGKVGLVSMCAATGLGAASIIIRE